MRDNIYASLPDTESATRAVAALLDHGVKTEDLSVLIKTPPETPASAESVKQQAEEGITFTTTSDAMAGAAKGAGIGLGVGALAAIAAVAIPGFGLVIGGGALATAIAGMAGATAAGAMAGGVAGYLRDQGVETEHVEALTKSIEAGGAIVSVSFPSGEADAKEIVSVLEKYGGKVQSLAPRNIAAVEIEETSVTPAAL